MTTSVGMKYRFLGDSGLLVSRFAIGGFVVFDNGDEVDKAYDIFAHGYKHGINFWDTAESYGAGSSERVMGQVLERGIGNGLWTREDIVLSTKICNGTKHGPNARGLGRKHLIEGIQASIQRLGVDYVDVLFCHRPEKFTPIEEVVRAMNFIIDQGWALYWGTSEWQEHDILQAREIADRLGLIRPIVEQPQYSLFERSKVEVHFQSLYKTHKLGLTTWSSLAYGILTGKYAQGIPKDSRLAREAHAALVTDLDYRVAKTEKLRPIAEELGCSLAQLALAWTASNENVSTVLLGASSVAQLDENLKAFPLIEKITPEIKARIEQAIPFKYKVLYRDALYEIPGKFLQTQLEKA